MALGPDSHPPRLANPVFHRFEMLDSPIPQIPTIPFIPRVPFLCPVLKHDGESWESRESRESWEFGNFQKKKKINYTLLRGVQAYQAQWPVSRGFLSFLCFSSLLYLCLYHCDLLSPNQSINESVKAVPSRYRKV